MAAFPPATVADPPSNGLPGGSYVPLVQGVAFADAVIASMSTGGSGGFVFDGTVWRPLK